MVRDLVISQSVGFVFNINGGLVLTTLRFSNDRVTELDCQKM